MTDLISRADAIRVISEEYHNRGGNFDGLDAVRELETLPSKGGDAEVNETKSPYMQSSPSNGADLISRADAIEFINSGIGLDTDADREYATEMLKNIPSAEAPKPTGDLISRADAIEELEHIMRDHPLRGYEDEQLLINAIESLPSAEAVSMEEHVKELNDLASAWKNKFINAEKRAEEIYDETMAKVANECKECMERLQNLRPSAEEKYDLDELPYFDYETWGG